MNNKQNAQRGVGGNVPVSQEQLNAAKLSQSEVNDILSTRSAKKFIADNPDYYPTKHNSDLLQQYVREHGLNTHFADSWQQAYDALSIAGKLDVNPETMLEEWEEKPTERHTNGQVKSFHNPAEIAALKSLPLKDLKKLVDKETAAKRAALARKGVRL